VLIFLALNAHLVLIELMVDSFRGTPPGVAVPVETFGPLIAFGGEIFAAGVLTSLPAVAALLFVNLAFGVMTRTSPQFNVFAVGFPVMIVTGLVIVLLTLPVLGGQVESLLGDAFAVARVTAGAD
jgi:flagellar biosynthetic protein FliR